MLVFLNTMFLLVVLISVICAIISAKNINNDNFSYTRTETSAKCNDEDYDYFENHRILVDQK